MSVKIPESVTTCPHADRCGGCTLLHVPYDEQRKLKHEALARALAPYRALGSVVVEGTVGAESVSQYRVRAKLVVAGRSLGLFADGSHTVVDIPECRILSPAVARVVSAIRTLLPLDAPLDAVDVREVDGGVLVTWIATGAVNDSAWKELAAELRAREPSVLGVALSQKPQGSARVLGGPPRVISGVRAVSHRLDVDAPFHEATYGSFVQAHPGQATKLYAAVTSALESALGTLDGQPVLELYAGSGALALRLAQKGAAVTAVESFEPAVRALERTARAQELSLRALAVAAEDALDLVPSARAVLVDPPRRGLSPAVRRAIGARRPEVFIYVSCEPRTLARDLGHFAELGLRAQSISPFDMIPLSDAVEALAVLGPADPAPLSVLHDEEDFVVLSKPAFIGYDAGPTGMAGRVRQLAGLADAVPVHALPADVSGACLFARSPASSERARSACAGVSASVQALVRGIIRPKGSIRRPERRERGEPAVTRYRRERVVSTHSFVRAQIPLATLEVAPRHLAGIGHPVLGDARFGHAASNQYFAERHGLDRPFFHVSALELTGGRRVECPLAPDLESVLSSLAE